MNTRTYTLSTDTLAAGSTGINLYETGTTNLIISFSGVEDTSYKYLKFLVKYSDDETVYTVQDLNNLSTLRTKTINRTFYPTQKYHDTHTIELSGIRSDLVVDLYKLNLNLRQTDILDYGNVKIIKTDLFTNDSGVNNLLLVVETQNPRYVANIIVPLTKRVKVATTIGITPEVPQVSLLDVLRTEAATDIGGFQFVVTQQTADFIIREEQLVTIVIGNQDGESIMITTDEIMIIPEEGVDYS